jgi:hypothetical protein
MTNTVGSVSLPQNVPPQVPTGNAASPAASATASTVDTKPLVGSSNIPISPRIIWDPQAGPIIEDLSSTGQIESQTPSAVAVAYVRAGLTSSGLAKPTPETQNQKHTQGDSTVVA